jgi:hypothetical protein
MMISILFSNKAGIWSSHLSSTNRGDLFKYLANSLAKSASRPTISFPRLKISGGAFGVIPTRKMFMSGAIAMDSAVCRPVDTHPAVKDRPAIKKIRTHRCEMLSFFGILFVPPYQSVLHITN